MPEASSNRRIGVISDTHGLMRPEALALLKGCALIVHAGDIGKPHILDELRQIAPVVAVRGNNDKGDWADALPVSAVAELDSTFLYVLHDLHELDMDPAAAGFQAVITGHSHQPAIRHRDEVLYLNPGSAGPRRFKLPVTLALLDLQGESLRPRIETLLP